MPTPTLSFAKIVATPTPQGWSQVYNAGGLFAVISLTSENEHETLAVDGKKFLDHLQSEFFGLEDKTFETIAHALDVVLSSFQSEAKLSLALCYCKDTVLYAYLKGNGAISLKRGEKIGNILKETKDETLIQRASGYLQTDDTIVLQTAQFNESVPHEKLKEALEFSLPNDIAETLSPLIHNGEHGGASSIILSFKGAPPLLEKPDDEADERTLEDIKKEEPLEKPSHQSDELKEMTFENPPVFPSTHPQNESSFEEKKPFLPLTVLKSSILSLQKRLPASLLTLSPRKKLFALAAVGITVLLVGSIIFFKNAQSAGEQTALFNELYPKALSEYEEGEALVELNRELALDDFERADQTLKELEVKIKVGSEDEKKVKILREKINTYLSNEDVTTLQQTKEVKINEYPLLEKIISEKARTGTRNSESLYTITSENIFSYSATGSEKETIIENDSDWDNAVGLGVFGSNLYVLDTDEGLIKFTPTNEGYVNTSYFSTAPDLSDAVSLAIDGSVYILFSDGKIAKYTRATAEAFSITGMKNPLSSPKMLLTNEDIDTLFVLEPSKMRILALSKSGVFQKEYQAEVLKTATHMSLHDSQSAIGILSNGKVYELSL